MFFILQSIIMMIFLCFCFKIWPHVSLCDNANDDKFIKDDNTDVCIRYLVLYGA